MGRIYNDITETIGNTPLVRLNRTAKKHGAVADVLLKLRRIASSFEEVPLTLRYDLKGGASKMRIGRTVAHTLALLVRRRLGA